jgi:hypothetical protein
MNKPRLVCEDGKASPQETQRLLDELKHLNEKLTKQVDDLKRITS